MNYHHEAVKIRCPKAIRPGRKSDAFFVKPIHQLCYYASVGNSDIELYQPDRIRRGRRCSRSIPDIQTKVVVIAPRSDEEGAGDRLLGHRETEKFMVEAFCFFKIGDVEVKVSDPGQPSVRRIIILLVKFRKE